MAVNPGLKRAYATAEYTAENAIELHRCMKDPIYFMTNYVKVIDPVKGPVPFILFDYQHGMVNLIHENKNSIMLTSRQLGKCVDGDTMVTTAKEPKGLKKIIARWLE